MKRWINHKYISDENKKIDAFIDDIKEIFQKHDLAIGHEDTGGAFQIVKLDKEYVEWLENAQDGTGE